MGSSLEAKPITVTYRDYIALEQQALISADTSAFWKQLLEGHNVTPVPMRDWCRDQKLANSDVIQSHAIEINEAKCDQLQSLAKELGVPLKTVLLAAHMKALQLLGGNSDVTTGVVLNGRPEIDSAEQVLGLFLNTVPYRLRRTAISGNFSSGRLLRPNKGYCLIVAIPWQLCASRWVGKRCLKQSSTICISMYIKSWARKAQGWLESEGDMRAPISILLFTSGYQSTRKKSMEWWNVTRAR